VKIHQLSIAAALATLNSRREGLSATEAARRLREYGPNRVEPITGEALAIRLFKELTHFFAIILWIAAALAFVGDWEDPGQGMAKVG
jgi:magnesium-transporting ATPase (P-type)